MGIVTDIVMILTLLLSVKNRAPIKLSTYSKLETLLLYLVLAIAFWNITWYASQNLHHFWGKMSLASGLSTIIVALSLTQYYQQKISNNKHVKALTLIALATLIACILQYSITLIQLNLE